MRQMFHRIGRGTSHPPRLNLAFYRAAYEDLKEFADDELREHWIAHGFGEDRIPSWSGLRRMFAESGIRVDDFNWPDYLALNQDLLDTPVRTPVRACFHFLHSGRNEGRQSVARLPKELLASVPVASDDGFWAVKRTKETSSPDPWWDRRAASIFARGAESRLNDLDLDALIVESYLYYRDIVPSFVELKTWSGEVDCGLRTRTEIFLIIAGDRRDLDRDEISRMNDQPSLPAEEPLDEDRMLSLMGFPIMPEKEWRERSREVLGRDPALGTLPSWSHGARPPRHETSDPPRASVLCSMFRTERYLDSFLGNIAEQTAFHECEFILVLVDPSPHELSICTEAAENHPNIVLEHVPRRIGIYEAWNRGIDRSSGEYLTNMNVDDLRRKDSLEIQIRQLDDHPWCDVAYQDVLVTIDRSLGWGVLEAINARTDLPVANTTTFMNKSNPPHNAPMWRRSLHDTVGRFDTRYQSAGDVDFWLRCARAGKEFLKMHDPHVAYFINPEGMSTQPDGPGVREHGLILREHRDLLVTPRPMTFPPAPFAVDAPPMRADRATLGLVNAILRERRTR